MRLPCLIRVVCQCAFVRSAQHVDQDHMESQLSAFSTFFYALVMEGAVLSPF